MAGGVRRNWYRALAGEQGGWLPCGSPEDEQCFLAGLEAGVGGCLSLGCPRWWCCDGWCSYRLPRLFAAMTEGEGQASLGVQWACINMLLCSITRASGHWSKDGTVAHAWQTALCMPRYASKGDGTCSRWAFVRPAPSTAFGLAAPAHRRYGLYCQRLASACLGHHSTPGTRASVRQGNASLAFVYCAVKNAL